MIVIRLTEHDDVIKSLLRGAPRLGLALGPASASICPASAGAACHICLLCNSTKSCQNSFWNNLSHVFFKSLCCFLNVKLRQLSIIPVYGCFFDACKIDKQRGKSHVCRWGHPHLQSFPCVFLIWLSQQLPNNLAHDKPLRFERKTVHADKTYTSL